MAGNRTLFAGPLLFLLEIEPYGYNVSGREQKKKHFQHCFCSVVYPVVVVVATPIRMRVNAYRT